MVNMDKWKTPLLILVAIVSVAFIGNQMGFFSIVGCSDYCVRSLGSTAETAAIGSDVDVDMNLYGRTVGTYTIIMTTPSNVKDQIHVKTLSSGDSPYWSWTHTIKNVQEYGTYYFRAAKCDNAFCQTYSETGVLKSFRIDAPSGGGTTPDPGTGGGDIPTRPADTCSGTTRIMYSWSGSGWVFTSVPNSPLCGYTPPSTPDVPQQPADRCDGTTKVTYSWSGSAWVPASQFNSVDCGYIAPGTGGTTDPTPPAEDSEPVDPVVIVMGSIIVLGGLGAVFMKMKK